ncbi:LytTR family DNA-binding domain-containing protein [Clostridium sp. YIM B02551]|uniref:LytR/AlgR family response regulator transcription factor n=1 Tax=Clostridium sp. YIM B02551 TaxID=2910679 RepID=UPI001EEB3625|nr:LytTR family DNA-binding domain-containing protein [Clostridium sp. YIM B02551]
MLKIALVDDENIALEELEYLLLKENDVKIIGKYTDPHQAIKEIKELEPDVVFLDVSMPEINGFMVAEEIKKVRRNIEIVFITAHGDYAIKAFEIDARDYVLKPFHPRRIENTMNRLRAKIYDNYSVVKPKLVKKIPIKYNDKLSLLDIESIIYCSASEGNVEVITSNGSFISEEPLNSMESRLVDFNFIKCHRKYLVNLDLIENIIPWASGTYILKMKGTEEKVPVSRNYQRTIKEIFKI